jgi:phage-related holin
LHSIGAIAILIGAIGSFFGGKKVWLAILLWAARIQFLTGLILAILAFVDDEANVFKLIVKVLVALGVVGLAEAVQRRPNRTPLLVGVIVLTIVNIAIAVAWH